MTRTRNAARCLLALGLVAGLAVLSPGTADAQAVGKNGRPAALSTRLGDLVAAGSGRSTNGENQSAGLPVDGAGSLLRNEADRLLVNIRVSDPAVIDGRELSASGATITAVDPSRTLATVAVTVARLDDLAVVPGLLSATEILEPTIERIDGGTQADPGAQTNAACSSRSISEADTQLRAAVARSNHGVGGSGVKVGILSDSMGSVATDVANGELPGPGNPCGKTTPVQILADQSGESGEGRAMAQLVHDLAPDATLLFATAFRGDIDFANQIRALRAAGADVIVDDITYLDEPMYQDGVVAKAVNDVTADGATYFSSAGNSNVSINGGTTAVGSYEADFRASGACPAPAGFTSAERCHDFNTGAGTDTANSLTVPPGGKLRVIFGYNQPLSGVTADLDIYLIDSANNFAGGSENANVALGSTFEYAEAANTTGTNQTYRLVVERYSGTASPRFKAIFSRADLSGVEYSTSTGGDVVGPTAWGHNAARSAATVTATPWFDNNTVEGFSSRGPATYCWNPVNGTAAASALSPCRTKTVDFSASDGTSTTVPGFGSFYGTSAAAPHAAAVAALMVEAEPCRSNTDILSTMRSSARNISGFNADAQGAGLLDADAAIGALADCPPVPPGQTYQSITPCRVVDTRSPVAGGKLVPGNARTFQVAGNGSKFASQGGKANGCAIPANAVAVEASITAVTPSGTGYARAWPAGASQPNATFINYASSKSITNTGTIPIATSAATNDLNVQAFAGATQVVVDIQGYFTTGTGLTYKPITPCRVVDTRSPSAAGPLVPGQAATFQVAGSGATFTGQGASPAGCGVPTNAVAVESSITAVNPAGLGFARAWPANTSQPNATFINYAGSGSITNTGTIPIATDATSADLKVQAFSGRTDAVIDIQGYYVPSGGSTYRSITPCRIVDTRSPAAGGRLIAGAPATFQVAGSGSRFTSQGANAAGCTVPPEATAVEVSITAVDPGANGYARAWPADAGQPNATFINYGRATSITNTGTIPIATTTASADLKVQAFSGNTQVVIDVQGYYAP